MTNSAPDLERDLRAMLRDRAREIDRLPARFDALLTGAVPATGPAGPTEPVDLHVERGRRRSRWLLAAAAAVVVAAAGIAVAVTRPHADRTGPVATQPPTTAPTTAPNSTVPVPSGPRSTVSLDWFRADAVTDYDVLSRESEPGYRSLDWRRSGETNYPQGSNGGSQTSARATVFAAGRFAADTSGVLSVRPETDTGRQVYRTEARRVTGAKLDRVRVPTVAWQYAPNSWVVIQALTASVANAELASLATAVHPEVAVPITLPFRLSTAAAAALPGSITSIVDSRPAYPLIVHFDNDAGGMTEFQLKPSSQRMTDFTGTTPVRVGGLRGYIDPRNGGYVEYADGILTIAATAGTDQLDIAGLQRIFASLTWSGGDGSGQGIALRSALPR